MSDYDLREMLLSGRAPKHVRLLMAQGAMPLPAQETLELLVHLCSDEDDEISQQAAKTLDGWDEPEIIALLRLRDCPSVILDFFAGSKRSESILHAIVSNQSASGEIIAGIASAAPLTLLEIILDNRTRILEYPAILESIRRNPAANARILGLIQEIETEFLGEKRKDYSIESAVETEARAEDADVAAKGVLNFEDEIAMLLSSPPPPDIELSLDGLPFEGEERDTNIVSRIASMPPMEKIKHALFGTREIRAILIRDTNREVARAVLRSPKLKDNEIEGISAMRSVSEDILREIGKKREWIKNTVIAYNLVKNPKTPPSISQNLMMRLRTQELMVLTRDRSIPDATRNNAMRLIKQRNAKGSGG